MKNNARIDKEGWCRCGNCGRRLFHIDVETSKYAKIRGAIIIEIKCHSCKKINDLVLSDE